MMASWWDIISSSLTLLLFLGAVYTAIRISQTINTTSTSTRQSLADLGVSFDKGRISITTDRPAPSRDEYIASTQRAFEAGARAMSLHPEAFKAGRHEDDMVDPMGGASAPASASAPPSATASGMETVDSKGFRRTKKLA